jgi:hypothetical protein
MCTVFRENKRYTCTVVPFTYNQHQLVSCCQLAAAACVVVFVVVAVAFAVLVVVVVVTAG